MRKKPYTAGELFNEIIKDIPAPDFIEFARPSAKPYCDTLIKTYSFNIYTRIVYGSNEGIYADVMLQGQYDIEQGAPDLCIGVIKTLRSDDEAVEEMYKYCSKIFIKGTRFVNDNLDDFTWLGFRIEYSPTYQVEVKNEDRVVKNIVM